MNPLIEAIHTLTFDEVHPFMIVTPDNGSETVAAYCITKEEAERTVSRFIAEDELLKRSRDYIIKKNPETNK